MRLYKRGGSPFYWYDFTISGKRIRESTKRTKEADAYRVMAREYEKAMNCTQFGEKPEITLEEAFDRLIRKQSNASTKRSYELTKRKVLGLDKFDRPDIWSLEKGMLLRDLTQGNLDDHVEERKAEGLSNNSVNIEVRVFKAAYNATKKRFACNPDLEFKQLKRFEKSRRLTNDEEDDVLAELDLNKGSAAYDKARDLFIFLIDTGVRLSEALDLQWSAVDLSEGIIENWNIKTGNETLVPISTRVDEVLRERQNRRQPFEEMSRAVRLLRKTIADVCNTDRRVCQRKGRATIHTLRDTYASRLDAAGVSILQIRDLLGHADVSTTQKYASGEKRAAVDAAKRAMAAEVVAQN